MQFSDTTTKSGLIQECEFWTKLGDGTISGTDLLLKQFTRLMNVRYAKVMARLQLITGADGAEDTNYTSQQLLKQLGYGNEGGVGNSTGVVYHGGPTPSNELFV